MAKEYTLLDVVQRTLHSINGDNVDSYNATDEALKISYIAEEVFNQITSNTGLKETTLVGQLVGAGDLLNPTKMTRPNDIDALLLVEYRDEAISGSPYKEVCYLEPMDFLTRTKQRDPSTDVNILEVTDPVGVLVDKSKHPQWYTSFDDRSLIFDSYDVAYDSTLQTIKSRVYYTTVPDFTFSDTFVIPLDQDQLAAYLLRVKERVWTDLKEQPNGVLTRESRREMAKLFHNSKLIHQNQMRYPNYGR